jgi:CDP-6-deoxy-D-xylo-4-hexulose-3-dehydrase
MGTEEKERVERVNYSQSVHGKEEIDAVVEVLESGPVGLKIGKNVAEMEARVAELYGKPHGLMVNSGSSAIEIAITLLGLEKGSEILTSPLTFSTDISPIVRAGMIPLFVDVEPDTYNVDVDTIEALIGPKTKAILFPNLIGNAPDWDRIREIADRHDLKVIEDSCDALGATLRGTPTGTRSDITVTSFALAHIITCAGNGGMVLLEDEELRDRGLMYRRWGRRSEPHLFGSEKARTGRVFREDLDGVPYDNDFIFDVLPWNMEPSEMGAAFGLQQLKKLPHNYERRQRNFDVFTECLAKHGDRFILPRQLEGLETAWLCYPLQVAEDAGFERPQLQEFLEPRGVDTRTVWSGNVTRHPMMDGVEYRQPEGGLPNADQVMRQGMILPCSHGLSDAELAYITDLIDEFVATV